MIKTIKVRLASALVIAGLGIVALPATAGAQVLIPTEPVVGPILYTPPPTPKYTVKTLHFRAADESGWDWTGSDEPFWVTSSVGTTGTNRTSRTSTFGDVDSGDTRSFSHWMWGNSTYGETAPRGLGFSIQLWEHDYGDMTKTRDETKKWFDRAYTLSQYAPSTWVSKATYYVGTGVNVILGWANDDLIGSQTYAYSNSYLTSRLPAVGSYFDSERYFGGASTSGGADYYLKIRIKRVQ